MVGDLIWDSKKGLKLRNIGLIYPQHDSRKKQNPTWQQRNSSIPPTLCNMDRPSTKQRQYTVAHKPEVIINVQYPAHFTQLSMPEYVNNSINHLINSESMIPS